MRDTRVLAFPQCKKFKQTLIIADKVPVSSHLISVATTQIHSQTDNTQPSSQNWGNKAKATTKVALYKSLMIKVY